MNCIVAAGRIITLFLLLSATAAGQTPSSDSIPYSRRVWRSADGLPEDFAQSLAQTHDGYLWIGTSGGLVRFDGTRFVVFNREIGDALGISEATVKWHVNLILSRLNVSDRTQATVAALQRGIVHLP